MKKGYFYGIFLFLFFFFFSPYLVQADYEAKFVATGTCNLKQNSTGNCFYADTSFQKLVNSVYWIDTGDPVVVITDTTPIEAPKEGNGSECPSTFSRVKVMGTNRVYYEGWACTDNIKTAVVTEELKAEFQQAGFPESYWESLAIIKAGHPNWHLVAIPTGLDFYTAVSNEDSGNKSLIQATNSASQGYLSTSSGNYDWDNDQFTVYDGKNWYAASRETIAYYMDPRNFLLDTSIFQFESLAYDEHLQTLDGIEKLLGTAYISQFANLFLKAGQLTGVNPVYLAALSKQEVGGGTTPGNAISGNYSYNGVSYAGYYNFYNIGATSGPGATARGLEYAQGGADKSATSYSRPWDTEEKAIIGGAQMMVDGYLNSGQNTSYFKKWNVVYNYSISKGIESARKNYTHQYQQNIQAPNSEARPTYQSYVSLGIIDSQFTFYIPVYENMPESTSLPKQGNPNNRLKEIKIDDVMIDGFTSSKMDYKVYVNYDKASIKLSANTINSSATVTGTGVKELEVGENPITLQVKAQNGAIQEYKIVIVRNEPLFAGEIPTVEEILKVAEVTTRNQYIVDLTFDRKASDFKEKLLELAPNAQISIKNKDNEKGAENIITGDTLTITSGEETKTFEFVLYGDCSGDGKITILDLLQIQKQILGSSQLSGAYKEAADTSKDGMVTILDLLQVQKHILGSSSISQK